MLCHADCIYNITVFLVDVILNNECNLKLFKYATGHF
ncbi:hypothetical protein SPPR111872_05535 [Sphingobacterium prati]